MQRRERGLETASTAGKPGPVAAFPGTRMATRSGGNAVYSGEAWTCSRVPRNADGNAQRRERGLETASTAGKPGPVAAFPGTRMVTCSGGNAVYSGEAWTCSRVPRNADGNAQRRERGLETASTAGKPGPVAAFPGTRMATCSGGNAVWRPRLQRGSLDLSPRSPERGWQRAAAGTRSGDRVYSGEGA